MKALVYNGPHDVSVENVPDAKIERATDVLVKITSTNICGSDLHMYEGRTGMESGRILGHENMGDVIEIGPAVDRGNLNHSLTAGALRRLPRMLLFDIQPRLTSGTKNHDRLCELGVRELGLFGSHARGDARPDSDVDFFVELDEKSFDRFMAVKELLEVLLRRNVDLVTKSGIKPRLREVILGEAVRAA